MSEQTEDPNPVGGAPLIAPVAEHPADHAAAHDYRKYGPFGATLAVATPITVYGVYWWGFAQKVPLTIAAIALLGLVLYLTPPLQSTITWLACRAYEKLMAAFWWSFTHWKRVAVAAAIALLVCVDLTGFWSQTPTEAQPSREQQAAQDREAREKHLADMQALYDRLIQKAEQVERDRLAAIQAKRVAVANTNAYVAYKSTYFEESLSSRSDTTECKTGCIGGKPMTIWEMIGLEPKPPRAPAAKHEPLKITPNVKPSTRHIY